MKDNGLRMEHRLCAGEASGCFTESHPFNSQLPIEKGTWNMRYGEK